MVACDSEVSANESFLHEIAHQLFLSEATVKTHLGHLMQKLDLRDRAQAVVLAYESGLVRPGTAN